MLTDALHIFLLFIQQQMTSIDRSKDCGNCYSKPQMTNDRDRKVNEYILTERKNFNDFGVNLLL